MYHFLRTDIAFWSQQQRLGWLFSFSSTVTHRVRELTGEDPRGLAPKALSIAYVYGVGFLRISCLSGRRLLFS